MAYFLHSGQILLKNTTKTSRSWTCLQISRYWLRMLNRPEMLLKNNEKPTFSRSKFGNRSTGALVILESP